LSFDTPAVSPGYRHALLEQATSLSCPAKAGHPVITVSRLNMSDGDYWIARLRGR